MEKEINITIPVPGGYEIDFEKSTSTNIVCRLKEKTLPKTWKEYKDLVKGVTSYYENATNDVKSSTFSGCYFEFKDMKTVDVYAALGKLIQLRDYYNDGWVPDWTTLDEKHVIYCCEGKLSKSWFTCSSRILTFKTEELRNEFYNNFKDLLEIAKPLL